MAVLYKIYMMGLAKRLKNLQEDSAESGFRKGMGTIDNIYVLNYLINRQLGRGRRMVALFVDLKTAFDMIDRKILCETMRERGIRKGFSRVKVIE